jgi:hypothetical protein
MQIFTRWLSVLTVLVTLLVPMEQVSAALLFSEDFESGNLGSWVGKSGPASHNGVIVNDPLESDHALTFTALNSGGDLFTQQTFSSPTNTFVLSFDYLGVPGQGGVAGDLGGFAGYAYGLPGDHQWLAGTVSCCAGLGGNNAPDILPDIGQWVHVTIPFTALLGGSVRLLFEDFVGSSGVAGDVYFDNIRLDGSTSVPEPSTMLLLGTGLIGLLSYRR